MKTKLQVKCKTQTLDFKYFWNNTHSDRVWCCVSVLDYTYIRGKKALFDFEDKTCFMVYKQLFVFHLFLKFVCFTFLLAVVHLSRTSCARHKILMIRVSSSGHWVSQNVTWHLKNYAFNNWTTKVHVTTLVRLIPGFLKSDYNAQILWGCVQLFALQTGWQWHRTLHNWPVCREQWRLLSGVNSFIITLSH